MILLQQLLAAILNDAAFGADSEMKDLIKDASEGFCTANCAQLLEWASDLDDYNNSGDDAAIPSALGSPGNATPKKSQELAKSATGKTFWDDPMLSLVPDNPAREELRKSPQERAFSLVSRFANQEFETEADGFSVLNLPDKVLPVNEHIDPEPSEKPVRPEAAI